jgi:hypothetical protein
LVTRVIEIAEDEGLAKAGVCGVFDLSDRLDCLEAPTPRPADQFGFMHITLTLQVRFCSIKLGKQWWRVITANTLIRTCETIPFSIALFFDLKMHFTPLACCLYPEGTAASLIYVRAHVN